MADDRDDTSPWPPGLGEDVRTWADPVDPSLPPDTSGRGDRAAARRLMQRLPTFGDPAIRPIQFAEAYAQLTAVALARAEFLGELLAQAYEREGIGGMIGHTWDADRHGTLYASGEEMRALVRLEAEERDRAAKLIRDGARLGLEARQVDVMRSYGQTVVAALRMMCAELGMEWEDTTRRAAMRAILQARSVTGEQQVPAGTAGPPLTEQQRQRIIEGSQRDDREP